MNYRMVFYVIGNMMKSEAALMFLAIIVALVYGETDTIVWFVIPMFMLVSLGFLLSNKMPGYRNFYAREGFVVVALSWLVMSFFGGLPFFLSGQIPSLVDSFFEAVSGFTTTGSTILTNIEALPNSMLFWRSFTHWIGGMGILVFVLTIMPKTEGNSIYLMRAEMPGTSVEKLVSKVRPTVRILYGIYLGMTILLIFLLVIGGMPLFDSIINAMGTAGTGGYSLKNDSIAYYNSAYIDVVLTIFMLMFAVNFNLYHLVFIKKGKDFFKSEELRWFIGIVVVAIALITIDLMPQYGENILETLRYSSFQVASIITTTGFATANFDLWPSFSKYILLFLMFIGACAGSTGGGIKVSRWLIIAKTAGNELKKMIRPRQVTTVKFEGKPLSAQIVSSVYTYLAVYIFIFAASLLVLSLDQYDFMTNFSAVATCINNVGPGFNAIGPVENFSNFSVVSKLVLCFNMLAGRLEIFPILMLFAPHTWKN